MISSSTQAFLSEASQSDPLGLSRASKKKNAKTSASVFSSFLEKAKLEKDGSSKTSGAAAQTDKNLPVTPARVEKKNTALDEVSRKLEARGTIDRATEAVKPKSGKASAETSAPAHAPVLQTSSAATQKALLPKDSKLEEEASGTSEAKQSSKQRASDLLRKDRSRDSSDPSADPLSAAAVSASASLAASAKNVKRDDAASKPEEKTEAIDAKKKDKKKDRLEIEVYDQRKSETFGASAASALKSGASDGNSGDGLSKNGSDLVLSLRDGAADGESEKSEASGQKTSFADALSRELRETYNGDIVKRASVVLKDGGEGLIRLALQPESLGSVKIKLELADNKIAGRILVETDEALKAFSKELRSLEQAFVDGGFDGASIELALSSGDTGAGSGRRDGADAPRPFFSDRQIATEYDAAVPAAEAAKSRSFGLRDDALIDMLA